MLECYVHVTLRNVIAQVKKITYKKKIIKKKITYMQGQSLKFDVYITPL